MDRIQNMLWWSTAARSMWRIVSEDLCDEFEAFKKKVYSYVDRAYSIVKAVVN